MTFNLQKHVSTRLTEHRNCYRSMWQGRAKRKYHRFKMKIILYVDPCLLPFFFYLEVKLKYWLWNVKTCMSFSERDSFWCSGCGNMIFGEAFTQGSSFICLVNLPVTSIPTPGTVLCPWDVSLIKIGSLWVCVCVFVFILNSYWGEPFLLCLRLSDLCYHDDQYTCESKTSLGAGSTMDAIFSNHHPWQLFNIFTRKHRRRSYSKISGLPASTAEICTTVGLS